MIKGKGELGQRGRFERKSTGEEKCSSMCCFVVILHCLI